MEDKEDKEEEEEEEKRVRGGGGEREQETAAETAVRGLVGGEKTPGRARQGVQLPPRRTSMATVQADEEAAVEGGRQAGTRWVGDKAEPSGDGDRGDTGGDGLGGSNAARSSSGGGGGAEEEQEAV